MHARGGRSAECNLFVFHRLGQGNSGDGRGAIDHHGSIRVFIGGVTCAVSLATETFTEWAHEVP